jgi:hypothetical protein
LTPIFLGFIRDDPPRPRHPRSIDTYFAAIINMPIPYTQMKTDIKWGSEIMTAHQKSLFQPLRLRCCSALAAT